MAKEPFFASGTASPMGSDGRRGGGADAAHKALEICAVRGTEVLGVRHLLEGGKCVVGQSADSIARIPMTEHGGQAVVVAEVFAGRFLLHVPPRSRARTHGNDGLGRIWMGPISFALNEGDRAVLVLEGVQIRARVVSVELSGKARSRMRGETRRWLAVMGALYVTALALCAVITPQRPPRLSNGAVRMAISVPAARVSSGAAFAGARGAR